MPRETAAEKRARQEQERAERDARVWAEFTASYPSRFANVLFEYSSLNYANFRVKQVDNETYNFIHNYIDELLKVTPPVNYNYEYLSALENVEYALREYREEQAEEMRKETVRRAALAKLSAEEKELLGL